MFYFIKNFWLSDIISISPFFIINLIDNQTVINRQIVRLVYIIFYQKLINISRLFNKIENIVALNKMAVNIISLL